MSTILNDLSERIAKARGMWAFNSLWTEIEAAPLTFDDKVALHGMVTKRVVDERELIAASLPSEDDPNQRRSPWLEAGV